MLVQNLPKPDLLLIKRVIGLPGETIEIKAGQTLLDSRALPEPYVVAAWHDDKSPVLIPAGSYFVMGDNRDNSLDSRSASVGLIPRASIEGTVEIVP